MFETAQEVAGDDDRIVLAANVHRERPVADREWLDAVEPDAQLILNGLGVVLLMTPMLFRVWEMHRENPDAAKEHIQRLHTAEAGTFSLT